MNIRPELAPQTLARIGGALYLLIIACGIFGEMFVRNRLVAWDDAMLTARNIAAAPLLWRAGIAGDLLMHMADVGVMTVFYILLRPAGRRLALLALVATLVQSGVLVANKLLLLVPLFLLGDAPYLQALAPGQAEALSLVALRVHGHGFSIGLLFFAITCFALGALIRRSGFLPRLLGWGMSIAGVCYLASSVSLLLVPSVHQMLFPMILLPPFVAELALASGLVVKGVDGSAWRMAAASA